MLDVGFRKLSELGQAAKHCPGIYKKDNMLGLLYLSGDVYVFVSVDPVMGFQQLFLGPSDQKPKFFASNWERAFDTITKNLQQDDQVMVEKARRIIGDIGDNFIDAMESDWFDSPKIAPPGYKNYINHAEGIVKYAKLTDNGSFYDEDSVEDLCRFWCSVDNFDAIHALVVEHAETICSVLDAQPTLVLMRKLQDVLFQKHSFFVTDTQEFNVVKAHAKIILATVKHKKNTCLL